MKTAPATAEGPTLRAADIVNYTEALQYLGKRKQAIDLLATPIVDPVCR